MTIYVTGPLLDVEDVPEATYNEGTPQQRTEPAHCRIYVLNGRDSLRIKVPAKTPDVMSAARALKGEAGTGLEVVVTVGITPYRNAQGKASAAFAALAIDRAQASRKSA